MKRTGWMHASWVVLALAPGSVRAQVVTITMPAEENKHLFINETMAVAARVVVAGAREEGIYTYGGFSEVPSTHTVAWRATRGSFAESYAPTTTFINISDFPDGGKLEGGLVFTASAVALKERAAAQPGPILVAGGGRPAAEGGGTAGDARFGFVPREVRALLMAAAAAPDRDGQVARLREAIKGRPADGWNLVLEFQAATLLGQNTGGQAGGEGGVRPEEALTLWREIVGRYDHRAYYVGESIGESCAPEFMVPRSAILAASTCTGLLGDREQGRAYAIVALDQLSWTFRTRTADWSNAPHPEAPAPGWGGEMEEAKLKGRIAAWEEKRRQAAAGEALGAYEEELAAAAVRQYGLSFGKQRPAEVLKVMQGVIDTYPGTPAARAAQGHIAAAQAMMK